MKNWKNKNPSSYLGN